MQVTRGGLLDGRLRYDQPATGFRTGIEPVLLAAAVPARPGDRVLEAGAGAGAATLCLLARVPGLRAVAVERDPELAALAADNLHGNGFAADAVAADLLAWTDGAEFDHAMANPPWHDEAGTASPLPRRDTAKRARPGLLADWARALTDRLRHRGTLTLILPAASAQHGLAALISAGCGTPEIVPLWSRAGLDAKLVILRAIRGGAGPCRLRAGLTLHEAGNGYTPEAAAILRGTGAIP